jgi:hypothetical protein
MRGIGSPPVAFDTLYTLMDAVPEKFLEAYLIRVMREFVAPGGTLIVGSYGSNSRQRPADDVAALLRRFGFQVAGVATAGELPIARLAWIEAMDVGQTSSALTGPRGIDAGGPRRPWTWTLVFAERFLSALRRRRR